MAIKYLGREGAQELVKNIKRRVKKGSHHAAKVASHDCKISIRYKDIKLILSNAYYQDPVRLNKIFADRSVNFKYRYRGILYRITVDLDNALWNDTTPRTRDLIEAAILSISNHNYVCLNPYNVEMILDLVGKYDVADAPQLYRNKSGFHELSINGGIIKKEEFFAVQNYRRCSEFIEYHASAVKGTHGTYVGKISPLFWLSKYVREGISRKTYLRHKGDLYELISVRAVSDSERRNYGDRDKTLQIIEIDRGDVYGGVKPYFSIDGRTKARDNEIRFILTLIKVGI